MILTLASTGPIYSLRHLTNNPNGMLAAILDVEFTAMNRETPLPGRATFTSTAQRFRDACRSQSSFTAYNAVRQLKAAYAESVEKHEPPSQSKLDNCATVVQFDKRNFIPRMFYALLLESRQRQTNTKAADRLQAMRDVLASPPTLTTCTTYDSEYRDLLEDTFAAVTDRPDVAASIASQWYGAFTVPNEEWSSILPDIVNQLAALRSDLQAAGDTEGARQCARWLARFCLGVIDSSPDSSTQCLAADLLTRNLKDMPTVADPMRRLIKAHTVEAPDVGTDWAAQFKGDPIPPLAPEPYESALERLFLWALFVTLAAGASIGFFFGVASLVAPTDLATVDPENKPAKWQSLLLFLAIAVLVPVVAAVSHANIFGDGHPFYSQALGLAVVQAMFFLSLSTILIYAIAAAWPGGEWARRIRRGWPALLMFMATALFLATPAPTAAKLLRAVNYGFPQLWWSLVGMLLFTLFAVLVARVPARYLARSAAGSWLCFGLLACIAMFLHVKADRQYQRDVIKAYRDPMAARVGADWQKQYIDPVKHAFNPPIP